MGEPTVTDVLRRLRGVATTQALRQHVSRQALDVAVSTGEIRRLRRGCYALPELPAALEAAARLGGAASHTSAAARWGLEMLLPASVTHVTLRRNAHPPRLDHVQLTWAPLTPGELLARITSPLRTVLDCIATLPPLEALAVADSALRQGVVTASVLHVAAQDRRGPGSRQARRIASWADGRAANPFESGLRAIVLEAGMTNFVPQVPVTIATGVIRVDLADEGLRLMLEADSFSWHGDRVALERDCRRYDEAVRAGWLTLRFAWEHVMFEQPWVGSLVKDVAAGQRRPGREEARRDSGADRGA